MKKRAVACGLLASSVVAGWILSAPPSYYEPAGPRELGPVPTDISAHDIGDAMAQHLVSITPEVPGHDEILPLPGTDAVLVSGRDEWIWKVDVAKKTAAKFAFSPVSPTGARIVPGDPGKVYYCMARLDHHTYEHGPGVYRLDLATRTFTEVVTRVPITGTMREDGLEIPNGDAPEERVYPQALRVTAVTDLDAKNSRPLQFCNDLDVSRDGRHLYITEPFSNPKSSSGLGAMPEGITLARNGRVWRYDTQARTIGLMVENIVFPDGILVEYAADGSESGLLLTETVNFRIGRAHLLGEKAGRYDVLWDDLPGLPDGLDRDDQGRVWVGLIKDRTPLMTWIHRHPWVKPALLRIPPQWLPPAKRTAILALSSDASRVLAYSGHDGSRVLDISVVVPVGDKLFLPSFDRKNVGLHYLPLASVLKDG